VQAHSMAKDTKLCYICSGDLLFLGSNLSCDSVKLLNFTHFSFARSDYRMQRILFGRPNVWFGFRLMSTEPLPVAKLHTNVVLGFTSYK